MSKYIWWITHGKGSIGAWKSKREAQEAIKNGLKDGFLSSKLKWGLEKHEAVICPTCGKSAEKDIIEGLGECLNCDHIKGDVMSSMSAEVEDEQRGSYPVQL